MISVGKTHKLIVWLVIMGCCSFANLSQAKLVAYWSFDAGMLDQVGKKEAELFGEVEAITGYMGKALKLSGNKAYIEIPIGPLLEKMNSCTIAMWVNSLHEKDDEKYWQRVFDFGSGLRANMYLTSRSRFAQSIYFRMVDNKATAEQVCPNHTLPNGWHHIAVVIDTRNRQAILYLDGQFLDDNTFPLKIENLGTIQDCWLGRSHQNADPFFKGELDEVAIFDHALESREVRTLYRTSAEAFLARKGDTAETSIRRTHSLIEEGKAQEAISYIQKAISQQTQLLGKQVVLENVGRRSVLAEMYFLLAKALEEAEAPSETISEAFEQSAMLASKGEAFVESLCSIAKHVGLKDCKNAVASLDYDSITLGHMDLMVKTFTANADWQAFSVFMDGLFSGKKQRHLYVKSVAQALGETAWSIKFRQYCRVPTNIETGNSELVEDFAMMHVNDKSSNEAVQIYSEASEKASDSQERLDFKVKACRALFLDGQYDEAEAMLEALYKENAEKNMNELYLLKARMLISQRKLSDAISVLENMTGSIQPCDLCSQAMYLTGYCRFLMGDLSQATEVLRKVQTSSPDSNLARKAALLEKLTSTHKR